MVITDTIVVDRPIKTSVTCILEDQCDIAKNLALVPITAIGFPKYHPHSKINKPRFIYKTSSQTPLLSVQAKIQPLENHNSRSWKNRNVVGYEVLDGMIEARGVEVPEVVETGSHRD